MKIRYLLSILMGGTLLWFFFRGVQFDRLYEAIRSAKLSYVLAAFLFNFSTYYLRALRWKIILEPMKNISVWNCFKITAIGFMINNLVPRSGDFVRPVLMGKKEQISVSASFATIFMERIFDFLFLFVILGILLLSIQITGNTLEDSLQQYTFNAGLILLFVILVIIMFMFLLVFKKKMVLKSIHLLSRFIPATLATRLEGMIDRFVNGLEIVRNAKKIALISLISLLLWELLVFQVLITIHAFESVHASQMTFPAALWMCHFVVIIGALSLIIPSPAGIGSFHLAFAKTLEIFGESAVLAKSIAILIHVFSMVPIMILGFYFLMINGNLSIWKTIAEKKIKTIDPQE